jgi:hypothetical protein
LHHPRAHRKRLWQAGLALALFLATLAIGNGFVPADRAVTRRTIGHDFLAFYTAGSFVRAGRLDQLYDLDAVHAFQRELIARERLELDGKSFGPYWNPPFFAWVFVPLSMMPYETAWTVWFIFNLTCCGIATGLLARMVAAADPDWKSWGLVPLLVVTSMPFIQALGHGQNTCLSLLLLTVTVTLWRGGRTFAAGAAAGLLFYKPQLGAVVAAALVVACGWRPLVGLACCGCSLLAINLLTLPGTLGSFFLRLPGNLAWIQVEHRYLWERHVTLKAFWRLLLQGYDIGGMSGFALAAWIATVGALAACVFAAIWRARRNASHDNLIAAAIASMPLLMPFYFDYDLLLLAVPATLYATDRLTRAGAADRQDRQMHWAWAGLFAWLFVNPALAGRTHVNGTVVLLACAAGLLIARAARRECNELAMPEAQQPLAPRAAA